NFVYDGAPQSLQEYGVLGGVRLLRSPEFTTHVAALGTPEAKSFFAGDRFALIVWDAPSRRTLGLVNAPDASYIRLNASAPAWQLTEGWSGNETNFRWIQPVAKARLAVPENAQAFEVIVNVSDYYISHLKESFFEVRINGETIGAAVLREAKPTTLRF